MRKTQTPTRPPTRLSQSGFDAKQKLRVKEVLPLLKGEELFKAPTGARQTKPVQAR